MEGFKSKDVIILTGAGFSKNFGAFLAKEMLEQIYNNDQVERFPKLRKFLLDTGDFELVYSEVLTSHDFSTEEKEAIKVAVEGAYRNLDNAIKGWIFNDKNPIVFNSHGTNGWGEFFSLSLGGAGAPGLFFTLNQDLIMERNWGTRCPGVPAFNNFRAGHTLEFSSENFIELPKDTKRAEEEIRLNNISYLKLHGSYGWRASDGSNQMVVGKNKTELIEKEPILNLYFNVFKNAIAEGGKKILIVGYSFRDQHINEILLDGVKNHGLRIIALGNTPLAEFKKRLVVDFPEAEPLIDSVSRYMTQTMREIFPANQYGSSFYTQIREYLGR